jgi:hypothetical protein
MYLFFRISMRKKNGVTNTLSKLKVGKDAASFIVCWLAEEQREWRG